MLDKKVETRASRSKEEWLKIFKSRTSSKKNTLRWCMENGIPESSYRTAYNRLFPPSLERSSFYELKDNDASSNYEICFKELSSSIEINFKGISLKICPNFDESTLLNLLNFLSKL